LLISLNFLNLVLTIGDNSKKPIAGQLSDIVSKKIDIIQPLMKERDGLYEVSEENKKLKESIKGKFYDYIKSELLK